MESESPVRARQAKQRGVAGGWGSLDEFRSSSGRCSVEFHTIFGKDSMDFSAVFLLFLKDFPSDLDNFRRMKGIHKCIERLKMRLPLSVNGKGRDWSYIYVFPGNSGNRHVYRNILENLRKNWENLSKSREHLRKPEKQFRKFRKLWKMWENLGNT